MTEMEMELAEALLESNKRVVGLMQVVQKLESQLECAAQEIQDYSIKEFNNEPEKEVYRCQGCIKQPNRPPFQCILGSYAHVSCDRSYKEYYGKADKERSELSPA